MIKCISTWTLSMIMCIKNLVKFCLSILKILNKKQFLTSIKGRYSASLGPVWPIFELCPDLLVVLVTCKNEEDPTENVGARVFTTLCISFSEVQGQITLELAAVSGRNLNSFKLSCMSSLPTRMRLIESKMKELECSQDFFLYKSMRYFTDAQGQLTLQSLVQSGQISNSSEMLWMSSLPASMKKIRSKMKVLVFVRFSPL